MYSKVFFYKLYNVAKTINSENNLKIADFNS